MNSTYAKKIGTFWSLVAYGLILAALAYAVEMVAPGTIHATLHSLGL